ncbi:MAG: class I SAM-dependent methyltransferase [Bacteroidetes bacterium]|nr:class I SAM-dependent methyltransferase [Bacteroidota bacterium]
MKYLMILIALISCLSIQSEAQTQAEIDTKVENFLREHKNEWHDLNVPYVDGQTLHNIIVSHGYTSALEIGTSTGHSTIWLAWAMSKTGGKVVTLERNENRHKQALKNLEEAGLLKYVEAHLGNAHEMVKTLSGPFDFVFSDADKDWYKQYFIDVSPKLKPKGCYTTHNVIDGNAPQEYLDFVLADKKFETTIDRKSRSGIMISYKK